MKTNLVDNQTTNQIRLAYEGTVPLPRDDSRAVRNTISRGETLPSEIVFEADDGFPLRGRFWNTQLERPSSDKPVVIISRVPLRVLSSGEKQIVSIFSRLYFSDKDSYFVIIDEPELSLSLDWQRLFLPNVAASPKCRALLAITHSPFVFENELDECASSLRTTKWVSQ